MREELVVESAAPREQQQEKEEKSFHEIFWRYWQNYFLDINKNGSIYGEWIAIIEIHHIFVCFQR